VTISSNEVRSIGIDVGGTKVLGVALSPTGAVVDSFRLPTPKVSDEAAGRALGASVANTIADVASTLAERHGLDVTSAALGLGVPGLVANDGTLVFAPNLQGAIGANLSNLVAEQLGRSTIAIDNDANCAAVAEHHFGAARGVDHAIMLTLGTGIGGAAIVNGVLLRGANGFAGEFGHMLVDRFGPPCPCGATGCFERFASGAGLRHLASEALGRGEQDHEAAASPEALLAAAAARNTGALAVVDQFCWWLAQGIASLTMCFDPRLVVLGGGVIEGHQLIMEPTAKHLAKAIDRGALRRPPQLVPTALGPEAGAVGAAILGERALP
jgi:glucokinase